MVHLTEVTDTTWTLHISLYVQHPPFCKRNWISHPSEEFLKHAAIWENTLVIYFILHTSSLNSPWCPQSPYHDPSGSRVLSAGLFCSWVVAVPGPQASELHFPSMPLDITQKREGAPLSLCLCWEASPIWGVRGLVVRVCCDSSKQRMWCLLSGEAPECFLHVLRNSSSPGPLLCNPMVIDSAKWFEQKESRMLFCVLFGGCKTDNIRLSCTLLTLELV